jgi:DNA replication regulator SLD3
VSTSSYIAKLITLQPYPSSVFDKPRSMKPLALIPRASLSLSSLDTFSSSSNGLPQSRLFESHIKILELEHRIGSTPTVLIARLDDGKSFYALEYDSRGRYALCKLGSWIDMERLCRDAIVSRYRPAPTVLEGQSKIKQERASQNPQATIEDAKYNKKKRLAIEAIQSMVKRPSCDSSLMLETSHPREIPQSNVPEVPEVHIERFLAAEEAVMGEISTPVDAAVPQSTGHILENIRSQYFEMLYLSKVREGVGITLSCAYNGRLPPRILRKALYQEPEQHII